MSGAVSIEVSLVLDVWLHDVGHFVVIQLHTVQVTCWPDWILRRISSALHIVNRYCGCCRCPFTFHCFPSFSFLFATLIHVVVPYFISFRLSSDSSGLRKSLISSSHLLFGLPMGLFVWCLVLTPGFHFAAVFAHRLSGDDEILIANRRNDSSVRFNPA